MNVNCQQADSLKMISITKDLQYYVKDWIVCKINVDCKSVF